MSVLAEVFEALGHGVMPQVLDAVANGECRAMEQMSGDETDDQGFPAPSTEQRIYEFIPCVWKIVTSSNSANEKQVVGNQVRAATRYKITVPRMYKGETVDLSSADQLELKQQVGDDIDPITLHVLAASNVSNVVWEVTALDIRSA